jgi:hypothetical protein
VHAATCGVCDSKPARASTPRFPCRS